MNVDGPKIRAVFDCMVFLQAAARRESPSGACLLLVELDAVELFVSHETMAEVRDVLARPRVRQKFPVLTDQAVDRFLTALEERTSVVSNVPRVFQLERDPKDAAFDIMVDDLPSDRLAARLRVTQFPHAATRFDSVAKICSCHSVPPVDRRGIPVSY